MEHETYEQILDKFAQNSGEVTLVTSNGGDARKELRAGLASRLMDKFSKSKEKILVKSDKTSTVVNNYSQFIRLIMKGVSEPITCTNVIEYNECDEGKQCDMIMKFAHGQCEVISDAFPQPFYVVITEMAGKNLLGYVWTAREFFGLMQIIDAFEGKIKWSQLQKKNSW